jgi:hypothetical protein
MPSHHSLPARSHEEAKWQQEEPDDEVKDRHTVKVSYRSAPQAPRRKAERRLSRVMSPGGMA